MRLLFLISVIAWICALIHSAPLDVRIARELPTRLHRRQVAYQGYPGYPEYTSSTSQYTSNQNFASQQTDPRPSQAASSAGWNGSPGTTVASTATTQTGQQQLATQSGAQVAQAVPVQANSTLTQSSLSPADNPYLNSSYSAQDQTQSSVNSFNSSSAAPIATNSAVGDSYPVYYVSNFQEPITQQPVSQPASNATTNSSSRLSMLTNSSSKGNMGDSYPVYYVTTPDGEKQQMPRINNTTPISTTSTQNASTNNTDNYPVYYVSSYNNETSPTTTATVLNGTDKSDSYPVYNVFSPEVSKEGASEPSKTEVPNSPITYKIINTTSTSQNDASQLNANSSMSASTPSNDAQSTASSSNYASSPPSAPTTPPATSNYNSTSAYPAPAPAPQPAPSYYGYPANQPSASPAPSPSTTQSSAQTISSSYPSTAQSSAQTPDQAQAPAPVPAPVPAPAVALAPAPASAPVLAPAPASASSSAAPGIPVSGVSSSPPFPPASESSSFSAENQTTSPVQVSNTSTSISSLSSATKPQETLNSEYENASYIIATPPEKNTVLFLPSPSFPLSSEATEAQNSNNTELNATIPALAAPANATSINIETSHNTVPASKPKVSIPPPLNNTDGQQIINSSATVIPQNITLPAFSNMTEIPSSSSEATSSPLPAPTDGPIIEIPLDIPSEDVLHSPPVVATKPPPSHLPTKPPPVSAGYPVPVTTKPPLPAVVVHSTAKPKTNEWGFGDKYLASQNKRARHRNVIFDGIAGDSQFYVNGSCCYGLPSTNVQVITVLAFSNYQVLSQQEVFFPKHGRKRRNVPTT